MKRTIMTISAILTLSACSTITDGTTQEINVKTTPAGAACTLARNNEVIYRFSSSPHRVIVSKSKHPVLITCNKAGYKQGSFVNTPRTAKSSGNNAYVGGLIGVLIDSSTGASNEYQEHVHIDLEKK